MNDEYIQYGEELTTTQLKALLTHLFDTNLENEHTHGERPVPICIWGEHGIGKTRLISDYAAERGWQFAYCAPAQFEEMGDFHGLPTRLDPDPDRVGDEHTVYLPPEWVPTDDGPGILLLDDINRADDRILRGIMQLLQNFEMFSWSLPKRWQIVCTANPEGGDYSVTPMDDAMLTRMLHLTMVFEIEAWLEWASSNQVDPRGIDFVATYPEVITGQRTTARSLTQFFRQIQRLTDLKANIELVNILAKSALDDVTVSSFLAYVNHNLKQLPTPVEILDATDFNEVSSKINELVTGPEGHLHVDRIAVMCNRLLAHISNPDYVPTKQHSAHLVEFLLHPDVPADLCFGLHRDIVALGGSVADLVKDRRVSRRILDGM